MIQLEESEYFGGPIKITRAFCQKTKWFIVH